MSESHPNVVNSDDLPRHEFGHGDNFAYPVGHYPDHKLRAIVPLSAGVDSWDGEG